MKSEKQHIRCRAIIEVLGKPKEHVENSIKSYVEKISEAICHFYAILKNLNRLAHATCFLIILKNINLKPTKLEEHEKFELVWATPNEILSNWEIRNKDKDYDHWIYFLKKAVNRAIELGYDKTSLKM